MSVSSELRRLADETIGPHVFGYLRPWMSAGDPSTARVFIVGANAATPFPTDSIDRDAYVDALVSGGPRLREIYLGVRAGRPSPTRLNTDRLVAKVARRGIPMLETNVWAIPTGSIGQLRRIDRQVVQRSRAVLLELVKILRPPVLIVHGATATRGLAESLGRVLKQADKSGTPARTQGDPSVWALASLSPPAANQWLPRSDAVLERLADSIAAELLRPAGS